MPKIIKGGPPIAELPLKKPLKKPVSINEGLVSFIENRILQRNKIPKRITIIEIKILIISGFKYFKAITPRGNPIIAPGKSLKTLFQFIIFLISSIIQKLSIQIKRIKGGIINLGSYRILRRGIAKRPAPNPLNDCIKVAKKIIPIKITIWDISILEIKIEFCTMSLKYKLYLYHLEFISGLNPFS